MATWPSARKPSTVDVRRAEVATAIAGPKLVYVNQEFPWSVTVRNNGDAPVSNVVVRATLPPEVRAKAAEDGQVAAGSVEWKLNELRAGDQKTFKLTAEALRLVDKATMTVAVLGDATNGGRSVGDPLEAKTEATVAIIGTPAVVLELGYTRWSAGGRQADVVQGAGEECRHGLSAEH